MLESYVKSFNVQVFEWKTDSWIQIGGDVTNSDPLSGEIFATSVELDYDGSNLVTGSIQDTPTSSACKMRIYTFDGSSWSQRGESIPTGAYTTINRNGSIVPRLNDKVVTMHKYTNGMQQILRGIKKVLIFLWVRVAMNMEGLVYRQMETLF